MTIENTKRLILHTGNDLTTVWPYDFEIPDQDSIVVELYNATTGTLIQTLSPSEFSVTGLGNPNGGDVTYPLDGDPLSSDLQIAISRETPYIQQTSITNQGPFQPQIIEEQLDLTTMQIQQLAEQINRAILVPPTLPTSDLETLIAAILEVEDNTQLVLDAVASVNLPIIQPGDAGKQLFVNDLETGYELGVAVTGLYPGMVVPWPFDALKPGYLYANFETIGNVGSGADHESADYFDAFQNLKDSPWNTGSENWNNGDVVRLPDFREVLIAGSAGMGGPAYSSKLQHATTLTTTLGSPTATPGSLVGLAVGMFIVGNVNVPADTTIIAIDSVAGTITMSENALTSDTDVPTRFSLINDPEVPGATGGADIQTLSEAQLPEIDINNLMTDPQHAHGVTHNARGGVATQIEVSGSGQNTYNQNASITVNNAATDITFDPFGGGEPHSNLPPTMVINFAVLVAPAQVIPTIIQASETVVGTSDSSITVGLGLQTFNIIEDNRGWADGSRLRVARTSNPQIWMEGVITSYTGNTLELEVDLIQGSGTFFDWSIGLAGEPGEAGTDGVDGTSRFVRARVIDTQGGDPATDYEAGDAIDGVTLAENDVVVRATTGGAVADGVYLVPASGAASRHPSFSSFSDLPSTGFRIMEGTAHADTLWFCNSDLGETIDVDPLLIEEFEGGSVDTEYTPSFTGASARTIRSRLEEVVSVRDFGALGQLGQGDVSSNIQDAIDYVEGLGGGTVRVPRGSYLVNTPVEISLATGGQVELDCGAGVSFRRDAGTFGVILTLSGMRARVKGPLWLIHNEFIDPGGNGLFGGPGLLQLDGLVQGHVSDVFTTGGAHGVRCTNNAGAGRGCTDNILEGLVSNNCTGAALAHCFKSGAGSELVGALFFRRCLFNQAYPAGAPAASNFKGAWAGSTAYDEQDVVQIGQYLVQCVTAGTSGGTEPTLAFYNVVIPDGTAEWQLLCHVNSRGLLFDQGVTKSFAEHCDATGPHLHCYHIQNSFGGGEPNENTILHCNADGFRGSGVRFMSDGRHNSVIGFRAISSSGNGTERGVLIDGTQDRAAVLDSQIRGGSRIDNGIEIGANATNVLVDGNIATGCNINNFLDNGTGTVTGANIFT